VTKKNLHALIVEDSKSDAARVIHLLKRAGYEVDSCQVETADQMRVALEKQAWDVIISDYYLPEFNAPAALALLQQSGKDIPFIVVSGTMGEATAVEMMKAGAHDYLMKDNLLRLIPALERELREAQIRRERHQAEAALADERDLLRTLLDHLPDKVYFKDLLSRFTRISKSHADMFGLNSPSEALGKTDFDFFTEEHALPAFNIEQQIIASGRAVINLEEKETWADGRITWASTTKMPLTDATNHIIGTFGISRDVTERVEAEKRLQESHRFAQATIDALRANLCVLDETGTILTVNQAWIDFADANPPVPDHYGVGANYLSICDSAVGVNSDEAAPFAAGLRAIMQRKRDDFMLEYPCHTPGGIQRWFSVRVARFRWDGPPRLVVSHADITERIHTEELLKLKSAALAAAVNAIVITDREGTIQWANHAFTKLTGYLVDEVVGKNPRLLKSHKQDPAFYTQMWETILAGRVWRGELINQRKNYTYYFEEMSITPLLDNNGNISHFIAIKQDITRRKAAEQALLEEKERYRSLYENLPIGMYRTTPEGQILMANPALVQMLGYASIEELAERNLENEDYGQNYSRSDFKRQIEQKGGVRGLEVSLIKKDGSLIFVRENGRVVRDRSGIFLYYEGTIEDNTEIHQSQMQNLRLVAAVENAAEIVILSDREGQIQYVNPAFKTVLGIESGEVIGRNILIFSNAYQDTNAWQLILQLPRSGQVWRGGIRTNHADGSAREMDATISPVVGLDDEISSLVYLMRDVTQERKAEMQRRQSQKLEAIGQLAAGIAHEINTPTQFIGNNLRFLKTAFQDVARLLEAYQVINRKMLEGGEPLEANEELTTLKNDIDLDFLAAEIPAAIDGSLGGIDRVTKIVNAMKEFSHPGTREKTMTQINHAIENTIIVSRNEWKYVAEMATDLSPDLPQIPCLVDEFNQVILNLINNAADAIREAQAKGLMTENGRLSIRTEREESWVVVKVADNGPGIPVEIQDRVFDPFFTTKDVGKGTGQGLSISYDVIVNKHAGKIGFETQPGQGTTFIIHLPIGSGQEQSSQDQ
jgi:PAS domain S-box-containing protein